jgi:hypothetical protein
MAVLRDAASRLLSMTGRDQSARLWFLLFSFVVPAKAGTHNHRWSRLARWGHGVPPNNSLGLWVPGRASLARDDGGVWGRLHAPLCSSFLKSALARFASVRAVSDASPKPK